MAEITVQELPANGQPIQITVAAASSGGDTFRNTGNERVFVQFASGAGPVLINGVPAPDSGRDGDSTILYYGAGTFGWAGPFLPRNWNNASGQIEITYPSGEANINIAVVRG